MSHRISIVRLNDSAIAGAPSETPIALNEWISAVKSVQGVRLASHRRGKGGDAGQSSPPRAGDADVFLPDQNEWVRVFRFDNGRITFAVHGFGGLDNPHDPVCRAAQLLAGALKARLQADTGGHDEP